MRILVLEQHPSRLRGGQERSLFDVSRGLAGRGHAIDLLHVHGGDLLAEYGRFCSTTSRVSGFVIDRNRSARSAMRLLADACRPGMPRPDVVYANQYLDSAFARLVAARFRRPFVCHLRLPPPDVFSAQYRWGMRGAARMIATSHQTRRDYAGRGFPADRIDVVHNGIDVNEWQSAAKAGAIRQRFNIPTDAFLLLYAGRFHAGKGIDVLIDALAELPARVHLALAGHQLADGCARDFEAELTARARERQVLERCRFLGHVAAPANLFAAADLTILPSVIPETFGRTLIESMACGTPAIGSRIGGIPEILTGEFEQMLVAAGDSGALSARVRTLLDWRQRDPQLGTRCRAHVAQHFDVDRTVAGVEAALGRACGDRFHGAAVSVTPRLAR